MHLLQESAASAATPTAIDAAAAAVVAVASADMFSVRCEFDQLVDRCSAFVGALLLQAVCSLWVVTATAPVLPLPYYSTYSSPIL